MSGRTIAALNGKDGLCGLQNADGAQKFVPTGRAEDAWKLYLTVHIFKEPVIDPLKTFANGLI
ncbi:MAG: hypothetical protein L3J36_10635 [Rhodobacteraceae bacterium]|nr:hypothetical protein [Paracoccaceae bacterium]